MTKSIGEQLRPPRRGQGACRGGAGAGLASASEVGNRGGWRTEVGVLLFEQPAAVLGEHLRGRLGASRARAAPRPRGTKRNAPGRRGTPERSAPPEMPPRWSAPPGGWTAPRRSVPPSGHLPPAQRRRRWPPGGPRPGGQRSPAAPGAVSGPRAATLSRTSWAVIGEMPHEMPQRNSCSPDVPASRHPPGSSSGTASPAAELNAVVGRRAALSQGGAAGIAGRGRRVRRARRRCGARGRGPPG
jgi:hypothetical protein